MPSPTNTARDRIAEMLGWKLSASSNVTVTDSANMRRGPLPHSEDYDVWESTTHTRMGHPIPATLDFVSEVTDGQWCDAWFPYGIAGINHEERLSTAFNYLLQRLQIMQANDPPAFAAWQDKARKVLEGKR